MQHGPDHARSASPASRPTARTLVPRLLNWFRKNARDLPWRRARSPYAIWVSEIMLQQTQVKSVIPYWTRWMRELPDVDSLARARPARVLKLWEGLGYYTRARNLHSAARLLARQQPGGFPRHFPDVLALPGVGRYTAGAICSIAYNEPTPILDGNVIRVLTRIHGIRRDPRERRTNEKLWRLASGLVTESNRIQRKGERNCSDLNQALMEMGALVCTPKQPRCSECPLRSSCSAFKHDRVAMIPNLAARPAAILKHFVAFVIESEGRFVVRQRPKGVVNAGLWEFPNIEFSARHSSIEDAAGALLGPGLDPGRRLLRIKHSITRFRIVLDVYPVATARVARGGISEGRLLRFSRLNELAFTSAHRKILQHLLANGGTAVPATPGSGRRRMPE